MLLSVNRAAMLEAFAAASAFTPSGKSTRPILDNVLLVSSEKGIYLEATDMECGCRIPVEKCESGVVGSCLLPEKFGEILRESTDEAMTLEANPQAVIVKGARSEFKLPSADPETFPPVCNLELLDYCELQATAFRAMISAVAFACDAESSRYALAAILIEPNKETGLLSAVGSDGRRLVSTQAGSKVVGPATMRSQCLYHVRSASKINRAIPGYGQVKFGWNANQAVAMCSNGAIFRSQQVEGRYPKWRDVTPAWAPDAPIRTAVKVGIFNAAVRQASITCTADSRGIDITIGDGQLTFSAATSERGASRVEIIGDYDGPPITTRLDHRFLTDFLKTLGPDETVDVLLRASDEATVIKSVSVEYVLMPLSKDAAG